MKPTILGIDRGTLLSALAVLPDSLPPPRRRKTPTSGNALPSWNEGAARQAIVDFVRITTEKGSPNFVAPQPFSGRIPL